MLQLLKSMQDQDTSNMNPDYILEEDGDIPTMFAKLIVLLPDNGFQIFY